jgi:general secretion pathway protein G
MRIARHSQPRRAGFTLAELLVVIGIIAILASLLSAAILGFISKGVQLQATNDISQLASALENFKAKYGNYPPSLFLLSNNQGDYTPLATDDGYNALRTQSYTYIKAFWPRITFPVDWTGGLVAGGIPSGGVILTGDQCLGFFLGGIPSVVNGSNGTLGFATNPQNPTQTNGTFFPPLYEFNGGRLYTRNCYSILQKTNVSMPFYSYRDVYSSVANPVPYVFFSSYKRRNGYNPIVTGALPKGDGFNLTYANGNTTLLMPYFSSNNPTNYYNPSTFQILCAGGDLQFGAAPGQGTAWTPQNANTTYPANTTGADDQCNFYGLLMGVPGG